MNFNQNHARYLSGPGASHPAHRDPYSGLTKDKDQDQQDGISNLCIGIAGCFPCAFLNSGRPQTRGVWQMAFHGGGENNNEEQPRHVKQPFLQSQAPDRHLP